MRYICKKFDAGELHSETKSGKRRKCTIPKKERNSLNGGQLMNINKQKPFWSCYDLYQIYKRNGRVEGNSGPLKKSETKHSYSHTPVV